MTRFYWLILNFRRQIRQKSMKNMKKVTFAIFNSKVTLITMDSDTENVNFEIIPAPRGKYVFYRKYCYKINKKYKTVVYLNCVHK